MEPWKNLLRDWQIDLVRFTRYDAPKLIGILLLAFILIRLLGWTTRKLIEMGRRSSPGGTVRAQQVSTLVGMIHSIGVFVIAFVSALQVLPIFGIHIEPLLASAGIAGLAIGFGAQTLVKDVINGFFILAENQFEVGDFVKTAGVQGTVEEITMRRTILRDTDGTVHTVPNSNIQIVSNATRDWAQVSLRVAVDYSEDSARVIQALHDVAREFHADPAFHDSIVAEPEVPGIERMTGSEVDYLMLVKVRPGRQQAVASELRLRIKNAMVQNGIKSGTGTQVYIGQMPPAK
ncbi:MAG TPA: mechanosensitive ion channel family protein [Candidatus Saccharimonadales bacterium]|jgi:small-conductance mechanosensitive channel|nr:mechanosensitive ion channel family protein [Candidatus Saccharimonadales bacterium]